MTRAQIIRAQIRRQWKQGEGVALALFGDHSFPLMVREYPEYPAWWEFSNGQALPKTQARRIARLLAKWMKTPDVAQDVNVPPTKNTAGADMGQDRRVRFTKGTLIVGCTAIPVSHAIKLAKQMGFTIKR